MEQAGLLLQVVLAGDTNGQQVENRRIPDQILLAGVRIQRNAERVFDGHDDAGIGLMR